MRGKDLKGFRTTVTRTMKSTLKSYSPEIRSACGPERNLLVEKQIPKHEVEEI